MKKILFTNEISLTEQDALASLQKFLGSDYFIVVAPGDKRVEIFEV